MNAIKLSTFQFSENYPIRAFEKNGISWFVAADVCKALDIQNPTQALEKLDDDERAMFNVGLENQGLFDSRIKEVNIINESGLYILILRSRNAMKQGTIQHKFRKWVTSEVLPQIRKTGTYSSSPKTTADDRTPLRQAVTMLVGKKHIDYSDAYTLVHQRFNIASIEDLTHEQIPQAIEYVHRLILDGEVLDKSVLPDELVLSIGRLLLHAQDMRLFVKRYLPAFQCLGIPNYGALWSYVHDTEPTFKQVREYFLQQSPYQNHHLFADDAEWVRRRVLASV